MTALIKLRELDSTTAGVTIPKDDLLVEGLADPDAEGIRLLDQPYFKVDRVAPGEWSLKLTNSDEWGSDQHGIGDD